MAEAQTAENPLAFLSQKLSEVSRRVRVLEEKSNSLSDKIAITDSTLLKNTNSFREDITEINISIKDLTKELETLKETVRRIIKQLEMYVLRRDFKVLEKYVDIIDPTKIITVDDVRRVVQEELNKGVKQ